MIASVIVDIAHGNVDKTFDYIIPDGMTLTPGQRALVPFGGKLLKEAYIIEVKDHTDVPAERLKQVHEPLDVAPVVLPALLDLAAWMKDKYRCLFVDALRLMIPAQMRGDRVHVLAHWCAQLAIGGDTFDDAIASVAKRAPKQAALLEKLRRLDEGADDVPAWHPVAALGDGAMSALRALEKKGWVALERREKRRAPYRNLTPPPAARLTYTPDQTLCIGELERALDKAAGRFLLHGVTGSGKTEVYIQAIQYCLSLGRTAIFLVPEISLTPQMVDWFRARFGDRAAVLHSGLSAGERFDEWRRLRAGEASIAIGARSAIFAPLSNLGLILIDEEHESSYLSDRTPRYDAREVARHRAEQEHAVLVLGSATPSIQTYMHALARHYRLLEMPERVADRALPDVHIVDMRQEIIKGNRSVFSGALYLGMKRALSRGEQAILFMNRRGYNTFVSCRECGKSIKCEQCDVTMTYHISSETLVCHYCGATRPKPTVCPDPACGSRYIKYFGAGTQMIESEVKRLFPGTAVLRADNDTTRTKDAHERIFSAFRAGQAQVLVGTQMIAKGLDFPNVTLVGVMAADASLGIADYRSEERTFQLLTQVAGRAGRGEKPGTVYVQTYDPDHYAIQLAAQQDFRAFYAIEYERRRRGAFPPFTILARVLATAKDAGAAQAACEHIEQRMRALLADYPELRRQVVQMRAMEAPISRIQGMQRWQVFCKMYAKGPSQVIIDRLHDLSLEPVPDVALALEINPANMI